VAKAKVEAYADKGQKAKVVKSLGTLFKGLSWEEKLRVLEEPVFRSQKRSEALVPKGEAEGVKEIEDKSPPWRQMEDYIEYTTFTCLHCGQDGGKVVTFTTFPSSMYPKESAPKAFNKAAGFKCVCVDAEACAGRAGIDW